MEALLLQWSLGSSVGEAVLPESVLGLWWVFAGTYQWDFLRGKGAGEKVKAEERVPKQASPSLLTGS